MRKRNKRFPNSSPRVFRFPFRHAVPATYPAAKNQGVDARIKSAHDKRVKGAEPPCGSGRCPAFFSNLFISIPFHCGAGANRPRIRAVFRYGREIDVSTTDDLKEAFAGESQANRKYLA
jgi:hypothetical protein